LANKVTDSPGKNSIIDDELLIPGRAEIPTLPIAGTYPGVFAV
jgi:hypothetical protein